MPSPRNKELYTKIKAKVYKKYPTHSAYRSGHLVREYKKAFGKKYPNQSPYIGKKPAVEEKGLRRWFAEDWKSDTGKYHYTSKSSVYRPTKRISSKTPTTFMELTKKEIKRAKRIKAKKGRVQKFSVEKTNNST